MDEMPDELGTKPPFQYSIRTLMIITAVIAVFLSLVPPYILRSREAARRNTCSSNIRQMALAMQNYESGNRKFPSQNLYEGKNPGPVTILNVPGSTSPYSSKPAVNTSASYSFFTQLIPQFEGCCDGYEHFDFDKNPFDASNGKFCGTPWSVLQCPSFTGMRETTGDDYTAYTDAAWITPRKPMLTQYQVMGATTRNNLFRDQSTTLDGEPDGFIFSTASPIRDSIIADGMAHTIMLVETSEERYATWSDGTTAALFGITANGQTTLNRGGSSTPYISASNFGGTEDWEWGPSSMHLGMAYHAFGDGAVRAISDDILASVYSALITKASKIQNGVSDSKTADSFFDE